jgi:putative membrane protein
MKNNQSQLLLLIFLFLYVAARILQLFAGSVPSLLIVALHVVPPALFAVLHGARIYRYRGILVFVGLCLAVGTLFESLSLRTGFPFGHYRFTDLMGPKIFDLPLLLALAYVGMGYLSWILSLAILDRKLSGSNILLVPLVASFVMTAWDLSMEAVWTDIDCAWVWQDGGSYFAVPISNFFGWLFTVYVSISSSPYICKTERLSRPAQLNGVLPFCYTPCRQQEISWLWRPHHQTASSWMPQANSG